MPSADSYMYDAIAGMYDDWSVSVVEDVDFYIRLALATSGPIVELAVGTGRIAVPIAQAGVRVIGIDESSGMLATARAYAEREGVGALIDLRQGDMRNPPVTEIAPLVLIPFRSLLHMPNDVEKLEVLRAAAEILTPDGLLVFDVFAPSSQDIEETDGRWLEREPEIFERADWDEEARTLKLSVRRGEEAASFTLHWLEESGWRRLIKAAGLRVEALHGWFDGRDYSGGEDMIWVCSTDRVDDSCSATVESPT